MPTQWDLIKVKIKDQNLWFSRQLLKVGSYFEKVTSIYLKQLQKAARHGDMCKAIISSTVTFASNNYKEIVKPLWR